MSDLYQWAIIAFILLGIGVAVWRGGQANPESTGKLARRLSRVELELKDKATTTDVAGLTSELAGVKARLEAEHELNVRTLAAVTRIESFLIQKAIGGE
ncbi:hypothetical protein [Sphingopyxis sp. GW247-27LB]|uniref:hypothetical protein n=1 Tax=Sphingopyxis sp. GW247-27LB TaxID=2012632 RepID=UPI000BA7727F|nr:hypothetical protein [Sphingopyxis sp. GW247-27LB]PAL25492.1 hypothetical protein CD928_03190 [Sphingopyxis sp. GW247-27LB]